ncbi:hypothetical protein BYT27DRAFT_6860475 [Phlegmacium glaucopus]|nr:hypothetical protein BYT27DRAFT_6860475 [Phlegmacium glaucopus]
MLKLKLKNLLILHMLGLVLKGGKILAFCTFPATYILDLTLNVSSTTAGPGHNLCLYCLYTGYLKLSSVDANCLGFDIVGSGVIEGRRACFDGWSRTNKVNKKIEFY